MSLTVAIRSLHGSGATGIGLCLIWCQASMHCISWGVVPPLVLHLRRCHTPMYHTSLGIVLCPCSCCAPGLCVSLSLRHLAVIPPSSCLQGLCFWVSCLLGCYVTGYCSLGILPAGVSHTLGCCAAGYCAPLGTLPPCASLVLVSWLPGSFVSVLQPWGTGPPEVLYVSPWVLCLWVLGLLRCPASGCCLYGCLWESCC